MHSTTPGDGKVERDGDGGGKTDANDPLPAGSSCRATEFAGRVHRGRRRTTTRLAWDLSLGMIGADASSLLLLLLLLLLSLLVSSILVYAGSVGSTDAGDIASSLSFYCSDIASSLSFYCPDRCHFKRTRLASDTIAPHAELPLGSAVKSPDLSLPRDLHAEAPGSAESWPPIISTDTSPARKAPGRRTLPRSRCLYARSSWARTPAGSDHCPDISRLGNVRASTPRRTALVTTSSGICAACNNHRAVP